MPMANSKYIRKIYLDTFSEFNLKPIDVVLMTMISDLTSRGHKGYTWAGKHYYAQLLNVTDPTIYNSLNKLESKGLITRWVVKGQGRIKPTELWKDHLLEASNPISLRKSETNDLEDVQF